jgi:DNA polymerase zeta
VVSSGPGALKFTKLMVPIVRRYVARLSDSLNYAIALSLKRDPQSPRSRYIRAVVLVKGIHFYGFNSCYSPFLKIHIVDPALVSRAVAIMQSGSIMGTPFRTFESHLSYVLQFLCDFGLYGCGWVQLGDVWQRGVDDDGGSPPPGHSFKPSVYFRQSRMELEFDTIAPLIMNRHNVSPRYMHHRLTIPQPPPPSEPLVLGVRELWDDERRRRTAAGLPPSPDLPQDPSVNSRGKGSDWVSEARWWEQLRQRIEGECDTEVEVKDPAWEKWVMTTFESVEALWEDEYRTWKPDKGPQERNPYADSNGTSPQDVKPISQSSVEVDESLLSSQDLSAVEEQCDAANPFAGDKDHLSDDDQVEDAELPCDIQLSEYSRRGTPQPPQEHQVYTVPLTQPCPVSDELRIDPVLSQPSKEGVSVTPRKRRRVLKTAIE